jgi:hypothetical protein
MASLAMQQLQDYRYTVTIYDIVRVVTIVSNDNFHDV